MTKIVHSFSETSHTPASNTGGKSPSLARLSSSGKPQAPTSRKSGSHSSRSGGRFSSACHVDTFTFSMEIFRLGDSPELLMHDSDAICRSVEDLFLNAFDMELSLPTGRRFNGYKDSSVIRWAGHDETTNGKAHAGFVAWGGNANKFGNETLCVHLTGQGCESINMLNSLSDCDLWEVTADVISQHDAKITRLDLAYDDLEGEFGGVGAAVGWYKSGAFCSGGRMPSVKQVGDWITGESRTFYIGKAENGKMMRIYEKGHQMGDLESPWVRYEVQIGSKDREIPVTALMFRDAYMAGTYPAMKFILKVAPVSIPTVVKKRLKVTLDKLTVCASVSYGKLINALTGVGMSASEVVETLRRDGLPSRMFVPPSAC